jgi:membrane protein implicated in regulation of membrane protease activity
MLEAVVLFLLGIGALLVSIASMLQMAWLAVIVPTVIAGVAAYWVFSLSRRRAHRRGRAIHAKDTDDRMAA